jgi:hypothetical protein
MGEVLLQDLDDVREWMRDKKTRALEEKVTDEHEADGSGSDVHREGDRQAEEEGSVDRC